MDKLVDSSDGSGNDSRENLSGESSLVTSLARSDSRAFDTIVRAYAVPLTRLVLRYIDSRDQADDIVQDTFVAIWEQRERLVLRSTLRAYLFTAARNRALNHLRNTRGRTNRDAEAFTALVEESQSESHESADASIESAVRGAMAALPDRIRQAALLRWQDGLSRTEVAQVMGTSVPTVNNQLTTAARRLRETLQQLIRGNKP